MYTKRIIPGPRKLTSRLRRGSNHDQLHSRMFDQSGKPIVRQDDDLILPQIGAAMVKIKKARKRYGIAKPINVRVTSVGENTLPQTPERSQAAERMAIIDFKAEAARLNLPLGIASTDTEARDRLWVLAADASDIFPDPAAAMNFLTTRPLDAKGRTGIQILKQKGLPGIISRLDNLRFGYSG